MQKLEPYIYKSGGGTPEMRGLLSGGYGYLNITFPFIVISIFYWLLASFVLAAKVPKDEDTNV